MKKILITLSLLFGYSVAYAGTCEERLGTLFTPFQRVQLCKSFGSAVNSSLIPSVTNTYDLGANSARWRNIYAVGGLSLSGTGSGSGIVTGATTYLSSLSPANLFVQDPSVNNNVGIESFGANAGGQALIFAKTRGAAAATNTIVNASDSLGNISWLGANGTGVSTAAQIVVTVDGTPGASADMPGAIDFQVSPDGSATPASALKLSNQALATFTGAVTMATAGLPLTLKTGGANAVAGTFVCNGTTGVVVNTTNASATMVLAFSPNSIAGTAPIGSPYVSAFTPGTSFTVKCSVAGETSTYNWAMVKLA